MELHIPNSAFLGNIESFVSKADLTDPTYLRVSFNPSWVYVHPAVLTMVACAGALVRSQGGTIQARVPRIRTLPYLVRMKLSTIWGSIPSTRSRNTRLPGVSSRSLKSGQRTS